MTTINAVTDLSVEGDIGVLTLNSPPVNALSANVRDGLAAGFAAAFADPAIKAIVLICDGRTFIAGADISELGGPPKGASLSEVQKKMEDSPKPVIAAIHGTALGGGLEVALCAHYRVAVPSAKAGLPEVNLGLLPGAGGTQRLPRIVGAEQALELLTSGRHMSAQNALDIGLFDELEEEGKLREGAIAFARKVLAENRPLKKVRDLDDKMQAARGHPEIFAEFRKSHARQFRGFLAPEYNIRCIEAAVNEPFDQGIATEARLFGELIAGPQSAAQRYSFFAERTTQKIPDVPDDTPLIPVTKVGVIGAGTMGGGIAMNFANIGVPVTLIDMKQEALDRGLGVIRGNYERSAKKAGKPEQAEQRMALITGSLSMDDLADVDLVIEAVFEDMEIKKSIFKTLDGVCKPGAILGTNTSYLDVNAIAAATKRPESVIGLHFFSPANVMKLVEIVRGDRTSKPIIATAMKLTKKIGKVGVLVGVCHGFVGNRMLERRQEEAQHLLLEGVLPWRIDQALYDFGFPMGPFAMADLAGLDVIKGDPLRDALCALGRRGQKTGAGFYDYDENRKATPSPVAEKVIREFAAKSGAKQRDISDEEIVQRLLYPVANEGAKILEEGKAVRASDIDILLQYSYGWPVYRGGPMMFAEQEGLAKVLATLKRFETELGERFKPAASLEKLVAEGKGFKDL